MITCKDCKKFAKLKAGWINGAGDVKLAGACKHCGYDDKTDYPKDFCFSNLPPSKIDYDDFEELGFENQ